MKTLTMLFAFVVAGSAHAELCNELDIGGEITTYRCSTLYVGAPEYDWQTDSRRAFLSDAEGGFTQIDGAPWALIAKCDPAVNTMNFPANISVEYFNETIWSQRREQGQVYCPYDEPERVVDESSIYDYYVAVLSGLDWSCYFSISAQCGFNTHVRKLEQTR